MHCLGCLDCLVRFSTFFHILQPYQLASIIQWTVHRGGLWVDVFCCVQVSEAIKWMAVFGLTPCIVVQNFSWGDKADIFWVPWRWARVFETLESFVSWRGYQKTCELLCLFSSLLCSTPSLVPRVSVSVWDKINKQRRRQYWRRPRNNTWAPTLHVFRRSDEGYRWVHSDSASASSSLSFAV